MAPDVDADAPTRAGDGVVGVAVVVELLVPRASREQFDAFDVSVSTAIEASGGPPAGLMAHVVRPAGDGFLICDVWSREEDARAFHRDILAALLSDAGFQAGEPVTSAVWSFARP